MYSYCHCVGTQHGPKLSRCPALGPEPVVKRAPRASYNCKHSPRFATMQIYTRRAAEKLPSQASPFLYILHSFACLDAVVTWTWSSGRHAWVSHSIETSRSTKLDVGARNFHGVYVLATLSPAVPLGVVRWSWSNATEVTLLMLLGNEDVLVVVSSSHTCECGALISCMHILFYGSLQCASWRVGVTVSEDGM